MFYKRLMAISYGHFAIDILNSSIAIVLTSVSSDFGLSVSQIGFGAMVYTFASALSQPFFGLLSDRLRGRWIGAIGLAWTMIFYALAAFSTSYLMLITLLTIGAFGSGAFHPVGIVTAAHAGRQYRTSATSVFFLMGQSGLALGPIISGILLQRMGLMAMPLMAVAMTPAVIMMVLYLRDPIIEEEELGRTVDISQENKAAPVGRFVIVAFVLAIAFRATTIQSFAVLLPKFFDDLGYTSAMYGTMIGIFIFGGATGTFFGGLLGDRMNRRVLMVAALLLSIPFSLMLLNTSGVTYFVAAFLAGAFLNVPHSIMLIIGQDLLPKRKGLMGGAVLGLMFASGAAMAWVASWFADQIGLYTVLMALAFLPIAAAAMTAFMPKTRHVTPKSIEATPTPAAAD